MNPAPPAPATPRRLLVPRLKVLYLLLVTGLAFALPAWRPTQLYKWYLVPGLLGLQVVLLLAVRVHPLDILRAALRLRWLFAFLLVAYLFLPSEFPAEDHIVYWKAFESLPAISFNLSGLELAGMMCLQLVTVILVSAVVRLSGAGTDFIEGLRSFGLPKLFVYSIDYTLGLLGGLRRRGMGGGGQGMGGGGGRHRDAAAAAPGTPPAGLLQILRNVLSGDIAFFTTAVQQSMERAREHVERETEGVLESKVAHDVAVITGISLMMTSMKMLKLLPGIPFFSGYKTMLLYPLYILAADLTNSRWGGTVCGTVMGVIGFLQGDGRYGAFEILKHAVPGLVIDLTWPLVRRLPRSMVVFCTLGFVTAIARTSAEFATVLLLRPRDEIYLFPFLKLIPNLVAGTLSGMVTYFLLPAFRGAEPSAKAAGGAHAETPAAAAEPTPSAEAVAVASATPAPGPGGGRPGGGGGGGGGGMGGGRGSGGGGGGRGDGSGGGRGR